jgi:NAD(P)-dependent dehydrogenase (short-subunit alcohol dehydrogenase family)
MQLSNAKAVITGGASGLGLATAQRVIEAGGKVVVLDINDEQGEAAAAKLGTRVKYVNADVSNEESVKAAIKAAAELMDGITLAVNCAGIATAGRTLGREGPWPTENFNRVIQVNLVGSYNVTKEAAAVMQLNDANENGERGVVISTASIAAFEGQIGQAAYSASKGGIVGMMLPLAREFAQFGIRVVTIAPGIFMTPMMAGMPEEVQESLGRQIPFPPRLGRPEEYADTVAYIYGNTMVNGRHPRAHRHRPHRAAGAGWGVPRASCVAQRRMEAKASGARCKRGRTPSELKQEEAPQAAPRV